MHRCNTVLLYSGAVRVYMSLIVAAAVPHAEAAKWAPVLLRISAVELCLGACAIAAATRGLCSASAHRDVAPLVALLLLSAAYATIMGACCYAALQVMPESTLPRPHVVRTLVRDRASVSHGCCVNVLSSTLAAVLLWSACTTRTWLQRAEYTHATCTCRHTPQAAFLSHDLNLTTSGHAGAAYSSVDAHC